VLGTHRRHDRRSISVQGVIKSYDPGTGDGTVVRDTDLAEIDLAPDALVGSVFRMLRQGQRVIFDLDADGRAAGLRLGSEVDMGTPGFPVADADLAATTTSERE
jgi:CspA family cold shock protein